MYMRLAQNSTVTSHNTTAVHHIEHYASDGDFVARWGILNFAKMRNRYMGRIFVRSGMGHLLNQHYLNAMFPLGKNKRVLENNRFMDADVNLTGEGVMNKARDGVFETLEQGRNGSVEAITEEVPVKRSLSTVDSTLAAKSALQKPKVRDFSRLWEYRNGGIPDN
jgi:hypothetical protein